MLRRVWLGQDICDVSWLKKHNADEAKTLVQLNDIIIYMPSTLLLLAYGHFYAYGSFTSESDFGLVSAFL